MKFVNIHEAKTHLSRLVTRVQAYAQAEMSHDGGAGRRDVTRTSKGGSAWA